MIAVCHIADLYTLDGLMSLLGRLQPFLKGQVRNASIVRRRLVLTFKCDAWCPAYKLLGGFVHSPKT